MKLNKTERLLVGVLVVLGIITGIYYFVLTPIQTRLDEKFQQRDELELQQTTMESILNTPGLEGAYRTQKQLADDNYDSFYSTLNSYTIDNILRSLMDENGLSLTKLAISPYEPVELPTAESSEAEDPTEEDPTLPQESSLLKSTVQIEGSGGYASTLAFIDAMNQKSFCLQVSNLNIQFGTEKNLIKDEVKFTCTVDIYGIETPEGLAPA